MSEAFVAEFYCTVCGTEATVLIETPDVEVYCTGCGKRLTGNDVVRTMEPSEVKL